MLQGVMRGFLSIELLGDFVSNNSLTLSCLSGLLNQSAPGPLTNSVLEELLLTGYFIFLDQLPAKPEGVCEKTQAVSVSKAICLETYSKNNT